MKKILIVNNNLDIGGIQISLINLLKEISDKYDITLLLFDDSKKEESGIPKNVKIITTKSPYKYFGKTLQASKKNPILFINRNFWAVLTKIFGRNFTAKCMSFFTKKLKGYDVAISFMHEGARGAFYGGANQFVLNNVQAKKKISWLHGDFSLCGAYNKQSIKVYNKFDAIVACSNGAKQSFVKCLPYLEQKCFVVRNCNDYNLIKQKSNPPFVYEKEYFNVLTVARLSSEKGIDRMLKAVRTAKDSGYKVKYHVVGGGWQYKELKELTNNLGLNQDVIFYGKQENPYPYMASCDLFVLPSYHEAAPMVFDECAFLGAPVLATQTTSTKEMIQDENSGYVCKNDLESLTTAFLDILSNKNQLQEISVKLKERNFDNEKSTNALQEILN